jgi:hypothetical protein
MNLTALSAHAERMRARISEWATDEQHFVEVLTAKSAGNFMYVVHVLRDIAAGALTPTGASYCRS